MTEKTLTEELQERRDLMPDKYTLAWWDKRFDELKQGYAGANHNINHAVASARDCWAELKTQRAANADLEKQVKEAHAVIGELASQLQAIEDRQNKMADWLKKHVATPSVGVNS